MGPTVRHAPQTPKRPRPSPGRPSVRPASAGLAVDGVPAVPRAELLQLQAVRVVAPVLPGDVVPLLALHAGQRDLGTDVGGPAGHGAAFLRGGVEGRGPRYATTPDAVERG